MVIRRRSGWTAQLAPGPLAAVLLAVVLSASGCTSSDELSAGDAATVAEGSRAEYSVDGGTWTPAEAGETIPDGAAVRPAGGELRLTFRDGTARLSADAAAEVHAQTIAVNRGEALISSGGSLAGSVMDTTVEGEARYRLASGLASRVGVYEGAVTVHRPAQERQVAALRELDLSAFRLAAAEPLQYQEADPWDQELLDAAIAFDGEAARLSRGMDVDLGRRPLRAQFYRQFAGPPVIDLLASQAAVTRGAAFGPPSDVLLTVFVAEAAAGDAVAPAVRRVTDLRTAGARWGLIAMELDVPSQEVVAAIDDLDGGRIAAADAATVQRRERRGRGSDAGDNPAAVAVAQGSGDGSEATTPDAGASDGSSGSSDDSTGDPAPTGSDDGPPAEDPGGEDPGGEDPGGEDPGGEDPGGEDPGGEDPGDGPGDEDPTPTQAVTRVVNDIVKQSGLPVDEVDLDPTLP